MWILGNCFSKDDLELFFFSFQDKPVLLVAQVEGGGIAARACVPSNLCNEHFEAESWLKSFADLVGGDVAAPKGQDPRYIVNMKNVPTVDKAALDKALIAALEFVDSSLIWKTIENKDIEV